MAGVVQTDQCFCDTQISVLLSHQPLKFEQTADFIKGNNVGALSFFVGEFDCIVCSAILLCICDVMKQTILAALLNKNKSCLGTTRDFFEGRQVVRLEYGNVVLIPVCQLNPSYRGLRCNGSQRARQDCTGDAMQVETT